MRHALRSCVTAGCFDIVTASTLVMLVMSFLPGRASAQNDWQYPDPYFGVLEIEKSHDGATARRYRAEVTPAPRPSLFAGPSAWQTPGGESAGSPSAPVNPASRPRWRNRWRRSSDGR